MVDESSCAEPPTIGEKTAGMERFPGFFMFYWDERAGKIRLEIDRLLKEAHKPEKTPR
jgi:hypothetical protein